MCKPVRDTISSLSVEFHNPLKMVLSCRILVYILVTNVTPFEIRLMFSQLFNSFVLNLNAPAKRHKRFVASKVLPTRHYFN